MNSTGSPDDVGRRIEELRLEESGIVEIYLRHRAQQIEVMSQWSPEKLEDLEDRDFSQLMKFFESMEGWARTLTLRRQTISREIDRLTGQEVQKLELN